MQLIFTTILLTCLASISVSLIMVQVRLGEIMKVLAVALVMAEEDNPIIKILKRGK